VLAAKIEQELLEVYVTETKIERRTVWRASKFMAISEAQLATFELESGSITAISKPAALAERMLARLRKKTVAEPEADEDLATRLMRLPPLSPSTGNGAGPG
jgi:hypothetical protein